jgi:hypothetical protein
MTYEVVQLGDEWYVHGPDDENHAGPFKTEAEAREFVEANNA